MLPGLKKQNKTKKPPVKKNTWTQTPKRNKEPGTDSDHYYHPNAQEDTGALLVDTIT